MANVNGIAFARLCSGDGMSSITKDTLDELELFDSIDGDINDLLVPTIMTGRPIWGEEKGKNRLLMITFHAYRRPGGIHSVSWIRKRYFLVIFVSIDDFWLAPNQNRISITKTTAVYVNISALLSIRCLGLIRCRMEKQWKNERRTFSVQFQLWIASCLHPATVFGSDNGRSTKQLSASSLLTVAVHRFSSDFY